jgi:putative flippase GtrA
MNMVALRFVVAGASATCFYAFLAWFLTLVVAAPTASLVAYTLSGLWSYLAQKYWTFESQGSHRHEMPRFTVLWLIGLCWSALCPYLLTILLLWPAFIAIILVCVSVPCMNFFFMRRFVYYC